MRPIAAPEDRALDAGRDPARTLAFFGIAPGMRVAEIGAGGGYTTELLVRVVGPQGRVYGQNSPFILARVAQAPWTARLAKPVMKNVVRLDREFDDPFPADLRNLDAVLIVLLYHDTVWMKVDRARMNRAVFDALEPGGVYGIVDHSAKPGSGLARRRVAAPDRRGERAQRGRGGRLPARRRRRLPAQSAGCARLEPVAARGGGAARHERPLRAAFREAVGSAVERSLAPLMIWC